jgi:hypothetical protein
MEILYGFGIIFTTLIMIISAACSILAFMSIVFLIQGIVRHYRFDWRDFIYIGLLYVCSIPFAYLMGYVLTH